MIKFFLRKICLVIGKYPLGIGEVNCLNGAIDFLLNDSSNG